MLILTIITLINIAVMMIIYCTCRRHNSNKHTTGTVTKGTGQLKQEIYYDEVNIDKRYTVASCPQTNFVLEDSDRFISGKSSLCNHQLHEETPDPCCYDSPAYSTSDLFAKVTVPPSISEHHDGTSKNIMYNDSTYNIEFNPSYFTIQELPCRDNALPPLHLCSSVYSDPQLILQSNILKVNDHHIEEIKELGIGQFGHVLLAHTVGLSLKQLNVSNNDSIISILVLVKRLHRDARNKERQAFEKEVKFMAHLRHENVVNLLGICHGSNPFMMMEYMENGDLNQYLQNFELASERGTPKHGKYLNNTILVYMCLQIATGMCYLSSMSFVHQDLAARNCLVGRKYAIKVSTSGISMKIHENSYYKKGSKALPIRWMSCECFYGQFSEKSDVWAFGVTMWEIMNLCKIQPYEELSDQEIFYATLRGVDTKLLEQPQGCSSEVYQIMERCWVRDPTNRASFADIHEYLSQIYTNCI